MSSNSPGPVIATAGWTIPRAVAAEFPPEGSSLVRYSARFAGAEINSTFHRAHQAKTYARWAAETPAGFRFSVKLSRKITHDAKLTDPALIGPFLDEIAPLGAKLGPLLVQLPPSLAFDARVAGRFFETLRAAFPGPIACEPRHASWFDEAAADQLLVDLRVARVAADPARHPTASRPGGWTGLAYWRLHGSPRVYYSAYDAPALDALAAQLRGTPATEAWCVFDNTASGAAAGDALGLLARLGPA